MANACSQAKDIKIRFGGVIAADGIDLDVLEGENLAIIGPNGAGKTTFLNICTGYLRPQAGTVGSRATRSPRSRRARSPALGIARAFQIPQLFLEHTVLENMLIAAAVARAAPVPLPHFADCPSATRWWRLLELVGCGVVAGRGAPELPEGQRKLVDIALALALRPRLLLMDEPTSGVASADKFAIMDILAQRSPRQKVTSVFVEHDMDMVTRYANRVAVWSVGKIQKVGHSRPRFWPIRRIRDGDRGMNDAALRKRHVSIASIPILRNISFSLLRGRERSP